MQVRSLLALPAIAVLAIVAAAPLHGQAPTAESLARSLQKRYATIRDFRANFTHEVQGSVLRTLRTTESGDLKVKKPGRVWMTYGPPQRKTFVADGTNVFTYINADRTGTKGPMPEGDDLSVAILFLAGRGDLVNDFRASMPATQPDGEWQLDLVPLKKQEDVATMSLFVDRTSLVLRGLTTTDHTGGTFKFRFTDIHENVGLKDSDFAFTFPRGTNVINSGGGHH